ncbi:MAG TPA: endonuclease V [Polyangiaceae bacterium]|nr:endonuclease V [Polyangiaceae bacterium]
MTAPAIPQPIAILDVQYFQDKASAACVVAQHWSDGEPSEVKHRIVSPVAPYEPGRFYLRELPALLAVLGTLETPVSAIIVDSYVVLDAAGTLGLGGHLYRHLDGERPVIGVAKTRYKGSSFALPVLRGQSQRPLFVTALGVAAERAAEWVKAMHGEYRIPTLLALADSTARAGANI